MLTKDFVVPSTGIHTHSFKKNTEDPLLSNITIKDWTDSTGTKSYDYLYNSKNSWEDYCEPGTYTLKDEYKNKIKCVATLRMEDNYRYTNAYNGTIICEYSSDNYIKSNMYECHTTDGTIRRIIGCKLYFNINPSIKSYISVGFAAEDADGVHFSFNKLEWITPFWCKDKGETSSKDTIANIH